LIKAGQTVNISDMKDEMANTFLKSLLACKEEGQRVFIDEAMENGDSIHALLRKVMNNPVTGASAYAMAVLEIAGKDASGISLPKW
jgi:ribosomal protein L6P/L9E